MPQAIFLGWELVYCSAFRMSSNISKLRLHYHSSQDSFVTRFAWQELHQKTSLSGERVLVNLDVAA